MRAGVLSALVLSAVVLAGPARAQDTVVATVNGQKLTTADMQAAYRQLPQQFQQMPMDQLFEPLRERLIEGALLLDDAKAEKLGQDAAVKKRIEAATDAVLQEAAIAKVIATATTDDKLKAAFDAKKSQPDFKYEEVKARHILVDTKEKAEAVIKELDGGADFAEVAKKESTGPSGPQGGDLGWFRKEAMVAPFAEAAFKMDKGSYTKEPVQTQFGWHVIQVEDKRMAEPAFEEMAPVLRDEIAAAAVESMMAGLSEKATIERFGPDGKPAPDPREAAAAPTDTPTDTPTPGGTAGGATDGGTEGAAPAQQ